MALSTGEQSAALSMGAMSAASAEGGESIAVSLGLLGKAKGKLGCFLVLAEWKEIDGAYHMVDIKTAKVDGKTIRPDTFYTIIDGEFTEEE